MNILPSSTVLPLKRIKAIMKCTNTGQINNEALFLMAKTTELFVKYFVREGHAHKGSNGILKYEHLSQLVSHSKNLKFLDNYVPEKISVKEFKEMFPSDDDTDDEDASGAESKD